MTDFKGTYPSQPSATKNVQKNSMQFLWSLEYRFIILKVLSNSVDLMKKLQMGASSKGLALTWKAEVEAEEPADGGNKG
mgnify:FL=1